VNMLIIHKHNVKLDDQTQLGEGFW
jgi:hypothetical protein